MSDKKRIRRKFRESVFARAEYRCECCGRLGKDRQGGDLHARYHKQPVVDLDAHHITPREQMPNGGYVAENGISVCDACHLLVEDALSAENIDSDMSPARLYDRIHSTPEKAVAAAIRLSVG